ncbi:MAG: efflux RND transporter permease subunit [Nitrosomonas sp.]|jgi:multidrug efflux pump subunit AcrB|nr:efflux RND transporter permease subunit [Nitrosomonas sp.]
MNNFQSSGLLAWFAANPVAANLLMVILFLGGTLSLLHMDKQAFPKFDPPVINISAEYPGAGPAEVEEGVCIPIEEAIHDLNGIKQIKTVAIDERCSIKVFVEQDFDVTHLVSNLRARTESLRNLPKAVERINIDDYSWETPAITVILRGHTDQLTLRRLAEMVRDELNRLDGVRRATLWNRVAYEIAIEVPAARLKQYQLTLAGIAEAVRNSSLDLSGGEMKAESGRLQLRAKHTAYDRERLASLILLTRPDGSVVRLGDIATITDGFADVHFQNTSDGIPSESIWVVPKHDLVAVASDVTEYVSTLSTQMPEGVEIITRRDNARSFNELLDRLMTVGITGFALVMLVLMLFLRTHIAFWTAMGVTVAFFGAFWLLPMTGVNLNMLTLFGFVLAVGVLVDDAIIVSERIHAVQTQGNPGLPGAIQGVREVATPVAVGVFIALIAFLPGYFVEPSWATRFMQPVATVMILTLAFSLLESLLILPAHLTAHHPPPASNRLTRTRNAVQNALDSFITRIYQPLLQCLIGWRYTTLAGFAAALLIGYAIVKGGHVSVNLQEDVSYSEFHVHLNPPLGTPYNIIQQRVAQFLDALDKVETELNPEPTSQMPRLIEGIEVILDEMDPMIYVEFTSEARKRFHVREIVTSWYRHIGDFGDFKPDFHTPTEKELIDLEIELLAQDPEILNAAADALKTHIMRYPGIADLSDSRKPGKPEIRFRLKPEGERLGLRLKDLAEQIRHAYHGEEAQRFMRGRFEVKIQVRHPRKERETIENLLAMPIRLPNGGQAQLGMLADIDFAPGFGALMRADRMGVVKLHVQLVDSPPVSAGVIDQELAAQFFPALEQQYRGIKISRGEAAEEADEIMADLKRNTLIALAMIYGLLAVTFKSYIQPLLFLLTVPVAWLGAVLIHWLMGLNFSFQSLVGMVAASGVVVNDSVVLLHFIRKRRAEFTQLTDLIVNVCVSRFRPILLVALTSIAGFAPMLFETSEQAKFLVPVTLSLAAGLSFGMIATLVLVPVCYAVLSDARQWLIRFNKTAP